MDGFQITSGGKGTSPQPNLIENLPTAGTDILAERVPDATKLLSSVFETDPVITYMLCSMTPETRLAYLPKYFNALLTAAAMNQASFDEIDDWKACGVLMSPGHRVDNPFTIIQAGFLPMLWNIGVRGCQVILRILASLSSADM
jgi:hypothetical protein